MHARNIYDRALYNILSRYESWQFGKFPAHFVLKKKIVANHMKVISDREEKSACVLYIVTCIAVLAFC